jgi:hypothetical protein
MSWRRKPKIGPKGAMIIVGAVLVLVLVVIGVSQGGNSPGGTPAADLSSAPSTPAVTPHAFGPAVTHSAYACGSASLWRHVYHPDRLRVVHRCMTVQGTVTGLSFEPDGDLHILLAVRPSLVNQANDSFQHGDLVLEEICQGPVTRAYAVAACRGVPGGMPVPSVGDRVRVSGSYVLDANHGWMEIHPVTSLVIIGSAASSRSSPDHGG